MRNVTGVDVNLLSLLLLGLGLGGLAGLTLRRIPVFSWSMMVSGAELSAA